MGEEDWTLHVLGHVYVSRQNQAARLPVKALALLTYLILDGRPHHREEIASLLWPDRNGLANLRVELSGLRRTCSADLFPAQLPLMQLHWETDMKAWSAQARTLNSETLPQWLSTVRSLPLSGLEDLGSAGFRQWVEAQQARLTDQVEHTLSEALHQFTAKGDRSGAQMIRVQARQLGLNIMGPVDQAYDNGNQGPPATCPAARSPSPAVRLWPAQVNEIRTLLSAALQSPQAVIVQVPAGAERQVITDVVLGTVWQAVNITVSGPPQLVQEALFHQISTLIDRPDPPRTAHANADLLHLLNHLRSASLPLVIGLHDARDLHPSLSDVVDFILELPLPLLVVLTCMTPVPAEQVMRCLGQVAWQRALRMNLAPLGPTDIQAAYPSMSGGMAAWLAQQSEGWPMYIQALLARTSERLPEPDQPYRRGTLPYPPPMPEAAAAAMVTGLRTLPPSVQSGMARLAAWPGRLSPDVLAQLLGEEVSTIRDAALRRGLLLPSSDVEIIRIPTLSFRTDDHAADLVLASELLRVALAATLTADERERGRTLWHEHAPPKDETAGPAPKENRTFRAFQVTSPLTSGTNQEIPRREVKTPNGYRVAWSQGALEVLRRGSPEVHTALLLDFGYVPAGSWRAVLHFRARIGCGAASLTCLVNGNSVPLYVQRQQGAPLGIPLGTWVTIEGEGDAGMLTLRLEATDLILTLHCLEWGGRTLIPTNPG
ncbi:AfsR/SARP family transcriptional regulator [Deinococcus navajonensis]|uniref:Bacterial transcriptional activator domain-containing protein n=1 Tax=Deinococcus navajonensis TaxID=309884 RepID=A0ABV8XR34_9DEIO